MRIEIYTLVDITKTDARRNDDIKLFSQQSNYNTLLQTATLRTNLALIKNESKQGGVTNIGFGEKFKGKHNYWIAIFELERMGTVSESMLIEDFDLVPIISGLDASATFNEDVFVTSDSVDKNIVFRIVT